MSLRGGSARDRTPGRAFDFGRMKYRAATPYDVDAIARLHAESWRRTYRGAYLDSFLDGDVFAERLAVWTDRLSRPVSTQLTVVADLDDTVVGFAHTMLDDDPTWGALLENLHVEHGLKRRGTGTQLMSESARLLMSCRPASGLYLWVLEQNTSAQHFYDERGGSAVERALRGPFPGGGTAFGLRYAWRDPSSLLIPIVKNP